MRFCVLFFLVEFGFYDVSLFLVELGFCVVCLFLVEVEFRYLFCFLKGVGENIYILFWEWWTWWIQVLFIKKKNFTGKLCNKMCAWQWLPCSNLMDFLEKKVPLWSIWSPILRTRQELMITDIYHVVMCIISVFPKSLLIDSMAARMK